MKHQDLINSSMISIVTGEEIDAIKAKNGIAHINMLVDWTHDNEKIFYIVDTRPDHCLFATDHENVLGYAIVREESKEQHLHVSWLAAAITGQRIGSKLMHSIIEQNKDLGKHTLTLYHRKDNTKAARFYKKIAEVEGLDYISVDQDLECRVIYKM